MIREIPLWKGLLESSEIWQIALNVLGILFLLDAWKHWKNSQVLPCVEWRVLWVYLLLSQSIVPPLLLPLLHTCSRYVIMSPPACIPRMHQFVTSSIPKWRPLLTALVMSSWNADHPTLPVHTCVIRAGETASKCPVATWWTNHRFHLMWGSLRF